MQFKYPQPQRSDTHETKFGITVKDPYRNLELPDSKEVQDFIEEQNKLSYGYIQSYEHREKFSEKLTALYDYERFGCPFKRGDFWYYFYNSGLQQQNVLYRTVDLSDASKAEVFFDPNTLTADGTAALSTYSFSESGKLFAYGLSYSGSDWVEIFVKDVTTGKILSDKIKWAKFTSIAWTHDDLGFFYFRYPSPSTEIKDMGTETNTNLNGMLYYHKIGQLQDQDLLVLKDEKNPTHMFGAELSDDGEYLMVSVSESCDPVNKLYMMKIAGVSLTSSDVFKFDKIVDNFEAKYDYITNLGSVYYFKTNKNASRSKCIKIDLSSTEKEFVDVIPESENVLSSIICVHKNNLVCVYMKDAKDVVSVYSIDGKLKKDLPVDIGSIDSITGRPKDSACFLKFSSFLNPGLIYKYDFKKDDFSLFRKTELKVAFDASDLVQEQIFYASKDGTKIPMFVVGTKNKTLDGTGRCLLYGYGGFDIPLTPFFSPTWLCFILFMGGTVAVANLRGGGEYGETWHDAGKILNKQNVFDDFQYAAKYLIEKKYTSSQYLGINGGSNGGLLVGACVNQAPELFGCAIADVGVMDMLRFHLHTIGHAWCSDYGNPDQEEHFKNLVKYSPYHNVRQNYNKYPSVLLCTSDHDDRVVPLHSYKFAAELQHWNKDNARPLLLRVETKAGHGAGKPTKKRIEEATDKFSFLALSLGCKFSEK